MRSPDQRAKRNEYQKASRSKMATDQKAKRN